MSDKKGRTLWEVFMDKMGIGEPKEPAPWQSICNPLGAKPGQTINIDLIDYRDKDWTIKAVAELITTKNGKPFEIASYVLKCGDETAWLNVFPTGSGLKATVFSQYDSFGADTEDGKAVAGIVDNPGASFKVDVADKNVHEEYWRVDDVKVSYVMKVVVVDSADEHAAPAHCEIELWDYWRKTTADDVELVQYFYVEQDTDNGTFVLKRGEEIDPNRATLI